MESDNGLNTDSGEETRTGGRRRPATRAKARRKERRVWTKTELRQLTADLKARNKTGHGIDQIARKYKRTPTALRQKMFSEGISAHGRTSR